MFPISDKHRAMTIDLQNLFAGCAGMEACTEDLSKYAEAAAKRDALEEKLKALRKLFKNPRCQAGWNKNVPFGFS